MGNIGLLIIFQLYPTRLLFPYCTRQQELRSSLAYLILPSKIPFAVCLLSRPLARALIPPADLRRARRDAMCTGLTYRRSIKSRCARKFELVTAQPGMRDSHRIAVSANRSL